MRRLSMKTALLFATLATLSTPAWAAAPIEGRYVTENGRAVVAVKTCGKAMCGKVDKILRPKKGVPARDINNDDPALRSRPILGLPILMGLTADDDVWRGDIYNPEDGNEYRAVVSRMANGSLKVQGCLAFICKTQVWKPAS
ncbi:DUF2147 domain-containing protein [Croceicoccus hydrothermalis]|uniref:DUF2147 domain-containing protein n=1 Tax=Croceicoccus hydrothermalis TaxID=2867964 RepID=UPI001EFA8E0C|nr:DUF2147 domain-containing protein [Croceicoccus hydrothermalis]